MKGNFGRTELSHSLRTSDHDRPVSGKFPKLSRLTVLDSDDRTVTRYRTVKGSRLPSPIKVAPAD
eukprot:764898-Hanusia_phi.AAC.3